MTENIELAVYAAGNLTTAEEIISRRVSPTLLEEHNQKGGGSFRLAASDDLLKEPGLLAEGKIVGTKVNGLLVGYWEIQKINTVLLDVGGKAAEYKEFSGPSIRDWLSHSIVMPWTAVDSGSDDRFFNYSAPRGPWYKAAEWVAPTSLGTIGDALFGINEPRSPASWPVGLQASWLWDRVAAAPAGDVYFRREFTTTGTRSYRIVGTAADYMVVLVDGIRVFAVTEFSAARRTFSADFTLPAGNHVMAVRARKDKVSKGNTDKGGVVLAMLLPAEDSQVEDSKNSERILWTGDGNWVMNAYPAQPPGFTVGGILLSLIEEGRARGVEAMSRLTPSFTATHDSNGAVWPGTVDPSFAVGVGLDEVAAQIADSYADVWVSPDRKIHAAPARGRNLAAGDNPLQFKAGRNVTGASTESTAEISNTVFVKSGNGIVENLGPAASRSKYGRRETYMSAVNASTDGTAPYLVKQMFDKYAEPRRTPTLTIHPDDESMPWADFGVGDWVQAPSDEDALKLVARRVVSISVGEDEGTGRPVYTVELDTIQESLENRLARWLQELGNSSKSGGVSGTSTGDPGMADIPKAGAPTWTGTTPLPPTNPIQIPAAPTNVRVSADRYTATKGQPPGRLMMTWDHSGLDLQGRELTSVRYLVFGRVQGSGQDWQQLQGNDTKNAGITGLPVEHSDGTLLTWETYVVAVGPTGTYSTASTIAATLMKADTTAPLKPSAPVLTVKNVVVTVKWNFRDLNGAVQPEDFDHAVVQALSGQTWIDVGTFREPSDTVVFVGFGYGIQSVRLVAVDRSKNRSPFSDVVTTETKPLVDGDLILKEIDAGKTTIKNAGLIVLETGSTLSANLAASAEALADAEKKLTGPGGLTERLAGVDKKLADVGALTLADGITLTKKLSDNATAISTAQGQLNTVRDTTLPKLVQDLGAAQGRLTAAEGSLTTAASDIELAKSSLTSLSGRVTPLETGMNTLTKTTIPGLTSSINGKTTINRQTTIAANPGSYSLGDRWERWDKLTTGGKLLQSWRHTGTAWVEEVLDASYLPLVDIGAGTFGSLSGGRLTANSVSTNSLLVGSFSNLIENGGFEYGAAGWAATTNWTVSPTGGRLAPGCMTVTGLTQRVLGPMTTALTPIEAGDTYRISGWAKTTATTATQGEICLYYYSGTGAFLSNVNMNVTDATGEWQYYTQLRTPPANAAYFKVRLNASMTAAADEFYFDDVAIVKASNGTLIVNGSITGDHVAAESVAAKIGTFVKINVENITATATANLNSVVAQRIAAGTASFQTVDVKNLFVTGTASLNELVAKRIAAETGEFIKLSVDQLTVAGTANMSTAVADRMFSNLFTTRRLTANQVYIGEGGNLFPAELNDPAWQRLNNIQFLADGGKSGGASILIPGTATQNGTYFGIATADRLKMPKLIAGATYRIRASVRSAAAIPKFTASVYVRLYPTVGTAYTWATGSAVSNSEAIPANTWGEVDGLITVPAGSNNLFAALGVYTQPTATGETRFSDLTVQEAITPELIVDGSITARTIEASEEMSAKLGTFLKLDVGNLTSTGTSNLNTAVIENLWTNVVRSRSITTDMLLVGKGANLIPNGDLANGKDGWSNAFGIYVGDPGAKANGFPAAIWYLGNGTGNSAPFSVKAGATYQFSMYARANVTGKRFYVQLITNDAAAASPYLVQNQLTYTATTLYDAEVTIGPNVTSAYLRIFANHVNGTTQDGHQWFSGFEMYEKNAASLIVTGGIVTRQLKITEDMTAALLKAKKVEAIEIDVNSLKADTAWISALRTSVVSADVVTSTVLKADAITSKHTLTGPLIRSAASGARTEMTSQGIRVLDASNVELVKMGYGIGTGMSIRNPRNGVLSPLANMVFGIDYFDSMMTVAYAVHSSTSSWLYSPDLFSHGYRFVGSNNAAFEYTAVSESALFFWENTVFVHTSAASMAENPEVNFRVGMNIYNPSGTGPGSIINTGSDGRMVDGRVRVGDSTDPGISLWGAPAQGHGVVTGMTPGAKYNLCLYLQIPTRLMVGATNYGLGAQVKNIRLTVIPR